MQKRRTVVTEVTVPVYITCLYYIHDITEPILITLKIWPDHKAQVTLELQNKHNIPIQSLPPCRHCGAIIYRLTECICSVTQPEGKPAALTCCQA